MTFETEYQLQQFREVEAEYFSPDGQTYPATIPSNLRNIMVRMLKLINQLEKEGKGKIILDKEKQEEFEKVSEPLIKFLCDNFHPHVSVNVDCCSAELSEGMCLIRAEKFIKD
jgi:hypothetical protein